MTGKTVFLTGATGYIGGQVLTSILASPTPPSVVTALIRSSEKAKLFEALPVPSGVTLKSVIGSFADVEIIAAAAADADITVSTASADNEDHIKGILEGQKRRKEKTGHRPLLIHTSGTGLFSDGANGAYPTDKIYTDLNPRPATSTSPALLGIDTLPDTAPHRNIDLLILDADAKGYTKSYIIFPSTIWGVGKATIYEKGVANRYSIQVPMLIRSALDRGRPATVGKGANIWPHVEIEDLGRLYALVYEGAIKGSIGHGHNGYYLGISGEYTMFGVASAIGEVMVKHGWAKEAQPTPYTEEEVKKYWGAPWMGGNSRGVADNSKKIGWRPRYAELSDFIGDTKEETVLLQKEFGASWAGGMDSRVKE